ncbi:hypothetical protein ACM26W_11800 [Halomonas sp. HK25]|uniref:hypothetical protein n=1 Tax=Halomonas sp. HK25 TaxID=3394321 RepID=UPI0039FBAC80
MVRSAGVVVETLLNSRLGIKLRKAWSWLAAGYQPDPEKIIWIDPADVCRKVRESRAFPGPLLIGSVRDGDWDIDAYPLDDNVKVEAVRLRFIEGVPWEATPLFARYEEQLRRQGTAYRGYRSLGDIAGYYTSHFDPLFEEIRTHGFDPQKGTLQLHIGRHGELMGAYDGNHRLAMAKVLGIRQAPARVWVRHPGWVKLMHKLKQHPDRAANGWDHPDLQTL